MTTRADEDREKRELWEKITATIERATGDKHSNHSLDYSASQLRQILYALYDPADAGRRLAAGGSPPE